MAVATPEAPVHKVEHLDAALASLAGTEKIRPHPAEARTHTCQENVLRNVLARRRLLHIAWVLLLIPVHWLLLSLAAWRALYQFAVAPYTWEKTEHGLAKSSRLADDMTRTLVDLERYLRLLNERGGLPVLTAPSRTLQTRDRPTRFDRGRAQDIPGR